MMKSATTLPKHLDFTIVPEETKPHSSVPNKMVAKERSKVSMK